MVFNKENWMFFLHAKLDQFLLQFSLLNLSRATLDYAS